MQHVTIFDLPRDCRLLAAPLASDPRSRPCSWLRGTKTELMPPAQAKGEIAFATVDDEGHINIFDHRSF